MTRAREAARLIGNNTFRLDSNNAVGFNSTTPDAMFDINHGLTVAGVSTFTGNVTMSGDLTVQGTTTTLDTIVQEVDLMNIQANSSTPGLGVTQSGSGDIAKFYDGTSAVFTIADGGGVTVESGTLTLNNNLDLQDNDQILLGSGDDLQIYHDGSNSYIKDAGTGNLEFHGGNFNFRNADGSEYFIRCINNNAVQLYWDNGQKLATKSDGIDVTGEVQCDSLDVDGAADITGDVTIADKIVHSGDTNTAIRFPEVDAFAVETAGSERVRVTSDGQVRIGSSGAPSNKNTVTPLAHVDGSGVNGALQVNRHTSVGGGGALLMLTATRGSSITGHTVLQSGDGIGTVDFAGSDGGEFVSGASIQAQVDGTPGDDDLPTRLLFSTTADAASSPTERMRISSDGVITAKNGTVAEIDTLIDASTVTPDFAASTNFTLTFTSAVGNSRTIANPSSLTAGQSGSIFLIQDATGGRTVSWGSYWDWAAGTAPTLSTDGSSVDRVDYIVRSSTSIHAVATLAYS